MVALLGLEKIAILAAVLAPLVTVGTIVVLRWSSSGKSLLEVVKAPWFFASTAGALAGVALVALLLAPPFEVINRSVGLRSLAEDLLAIGFAALISVVLSFAIYRLTRSLKGASLVLTLAIVPLIATLPFLGLQAVVGENRDKAKSVPFYYGHPVGVAITNRASAKLVASGVQFPSSLTTDSKGRIIFTEAQSGKIGLLDPRPDGTYETKIIAQIALPEGIFAEQGVWHAALDPEERYLYVAAIESLNPDPAAVRVDSSARPNYTSGHTSRLVRFLYEEGQVGSMEVLLSGLPAGQVHSGGALTFGPDGNLYLSIGDTNSPYLALVPRSIVGSILRLTPQGLIPSDNPFPGSPVYAYGFRNPYGIAFHPENKMLYATDNGNECCDRLLLVERGKFHGWPLYGQTPGYLSRMKQDPKVVTPLSDTGWARTAPTQLLAYSGKRYGDEFQGNLFFGTFSEAALRRVVLSQDGLQVVKDEVIWQSSPPQAVIGVTATPDGFIYFSTITGIFRIEGFN